MIKVSVCIHSNLINKNECKHSIFGGKGKGFDQIKDIPNSFVVNDDVEIGHGNKIPLWLFGFLY